MSLSASWIRGRRVVSAPFVGPVSAAMLDPLCPFVDKPFMLNVMASELRQTTMQDLCDATDS